MSGTGGEKKREREIYKRGEGWRKAETKIEKIVCGGSKKKV